LSLASIWKALKQGFSYYAGTPESFERQKPFEHKDGSLKSLMSFF